jgi:3-deoxy-D-manno-octulosonic-acid transferase
MLLYNLAVRTYGAVIRAASLRNPKAGQWVKGRKNWRQSLSEQKAKLFSGEVIWVHCASYGEFEQGRPIIEGLRKKYPSCAIVLTFFSPSGYEAFSDWAGADVVAYLPLDTKRNAADFLDIVQPKLVVFIKYEFWLNFLDALRERMIPTYLVSAVFKPHHPFFRWYGGVFRRSLRTFTHLFIQDQGSARLLDSIGITNHTVEGDTRFDRVLEIRNTPKDIPGIAEFTNGKPLIVAGSTWPKDEALVLETWQMMKGGLKLMIAPHDIAPKFVERLCAKLGKAGISYCIYSRGIDRKADVMVLDTMGMLARSYRYASCAYIGGGFNGGLHNCLEAAVYGIPVTFYGDHHHKFNEAVDLIELGAAVCVEDAGELHAAWEQYSRGGENRKRIAESLDRYFSSNANSSGRIVASMSY